MKLYLLVLGFLGVLVTVVHGGENDDTAVAARSDKYYDELWYRHWTFPVTMAIKAKVIAWVLFITYFSTILQAIVYQRSEPSLPEVYSVPANSEWGYPPSNSWG
ncbi:uncharacterized protein LOC131294675 [Anopheles ziemanni]|uniref:uncharacterized protein LOC131265268 n=1 Tax=Anopheles coustani TaxID=139045 RepID=UPI00265AACAF|nr:uncharacterized protein LOC131265268 [Anopheles coustani]XP_058178701.1 uncharacterized protein LOC131294675 [Anopheles ziemanni]